LSNNIRSKIGDGVYVTTGTLAPGHSSCDGIAKPGIDRPDITAGDKTATYRCICNVSECAASNVRRRNFQDRAVVKVPSTKWFQTIVIAETHLCCGG
jgi:hypothetical protein